jgi:putative acetyltransferase
MKRSMVTVRLEKTEDIPAVRDIHLQAFGQPVEADLVDQLRQNCPDALSLVAEDGGRVVGHILFTPVAVESGDNVIRGMGLAPLAVLPERQNETIGSRLVESGLTMLKERRCPFVMVLGHPQYYPRFGFRPASVCGLTSQWPGLQEEAFMVLVLDHAVMDGISGVARYRFEFDAAM